MLLSLSVLHFTRLSHRQCYEIVFFFILKASSHSRPRRHNTTSPEAVCQETQERQRILYLGFTAEAPHDKIFSFNCIYDFIRLQLCVVTPSYLSYRHVMLKSFHFLFGQMQNNIEFRCRRTATSVLQLYIVTSCAQWPLVSFISGSR